MSNQLVKQEHGIAQSFDLFNPTIFESVQRMANMYSKSELVPKMYQAGTSGAEKAVANCIIAMETAQRIGASSLMVMQNMYIVHGQPAWSAKFLTATVNACGRYNPIKYKMENLGMIKVPGTTLEVENTQCIAYTSEKGSDEVLEGVPVSVQMAIDEGWYTKNGSKWKTMPKLMLQYRSVTFWTRAYAPEISMGLKTEDEVYDIVDTPYEEIPNVEEKVAAEIKKEANAETISMDGAKAVDKPEDKPTPPPSEEKNPEQLTGRKPLFEG